MNECILVVDDEQLLIKGIRFNLEGEGYTVQAAYDGQTAVDLARQEHFGEGRLLRAFPHMQAPRYDEVLTRLRTATARLARTARRLKNKVSGQ